MHLEDEFERDFDVFRPILDNYPTVTQMIEAFLRRGGYVDADRSLEELRRVMDAILRDKVTAEMSGPVTKSTSGAAIRMREMLRDQFNRVRFDFVRSLKHEADTIADDSERARYLHGAADRLARRWGTEEPVASIVESIREMVRATERPLPTAPPPIPWRQTQTHLAIVLDILYEEGVHPDIRLPDDAQILEKVSKDEYVRRLLPLFVSAKTAARFNLDSVTSHLTDCPAYRVEIENEVAKRVEKRGESE